MTNRRTSRQSKGQATVEGAVMLTIITGVFVAFVAIALDAWTFINYSDRIRIAAQAAARVNASGRSLFNCMLLTDPKVIEAAENKAKLVGEVMLTKLGVPGTRVIEPPEIITAANGTRMSRCRISVNLLPIPFRHITGLPGTVTIEGVEVLAFSPARIARITVPTIANGDPIIRRLNNANFTDSSLDPNGINHVAINFPIFQADNVALDDPGAERNLGFFENSNPGFFPGGFAPKYNTALGFHVLGKAMNVQGKTVPFAPH